jgi:transketolase
MPALSSTGAASAPTLEWSDLDDRAIAVSRALALDAVERCGNGHPGTAVSLAPAAYLLFQRHLRHDPADPQWIGRDRFVLSAGHTSLTLYTQLFLSGYGLELADLKQLRTWGSRTPGHPEWGLTPGVETTTGPLGQGLANGVGMAMAARRVRGLLDPDAAAGESILDHTVWVLASDGDMQEGVAAEASSLAGTQELGNLVVLWDDNHISIDDDTSIAFTEDVCARYEAYGWHVQRVDWLASGAGGDTYVEYLPALDRALKAAKDEQGRPSFIALRTVIGWPAPTMQNTGAIHGAKVGADEVRATKRVLGLDPDVDFAVSEEVLQHARDVKRRGAELRDRWEQDRAAWARAHPAQADLLDRLQRRELPAGWDEALPEFEPGTAVATRKASGLFLGAVAPRLPELWGGSADLSNSNNTVPIDQPSFLPAHRSSGLFRGDRYGRVVHFGIREHAMGAILNGIALHGLTRPYGGTFLVFSDYMRPSIRLAALMQLPVIFVLTHDSIGLGEDGPTHQPVEHLAALRAIPGLNVVRPADANETVAIGRTIIERMDNLPGAPTGLCLSRQDVPVLDGVSVEGAAKGGYVLREADGSPEVLLVATGSEVDLALQAREVLQGDGLPTRVVSMPCLEWFQRQDQDYRDSVLPPEVRTRVSVEAGLASPWLPIVGPLGRSVSLEHFGASADHRTLYEQFGITAEAVVAAAHDSRRAVEASC